MTFFKNSSVILLFLIISCVFSYAEQEYTEVKCGVSVKKPEYKEGKKIKFEVYCAHNSEDVVNLPEKFFTQPAYLAKALKFTNQTGQEFCLMDKRYSTDERFYRWVAHNPNEMITEITFPDKRLDKFRFVSCQARDELRPEDILEREDLYRVAREVIPAGEYMIKLNLPIEWQTVNMGYHKLILTDAENKNNKVADPQWWKIINDVEPIQLIIK